MLPRACRAAWDHEPVACRDVKRRRTEAGARPGHERVAADAMAFEPLADAPPASSPIHNVKQRSLLRSRLILRPGFLPSSFLLRRCRPPSEGIGGAPRDVQP